MDIGVGVEQVESQETDRDFKTLSGDVTQYWVMEKVDPFRKGQHIYEINGEKYVAIGYCSSEKDAHGFCWPGRIIAMVTCHDYRPEDRLAHKKLWTFLAWIFPAKLERL